MDAEQLQNSLGDYYYYCIGCSFMYLFIYVCREESGYINIYKYNILHKIKW